jgi:quinol-cytochrome oxidoreductase complex cytochrome b subunit/NAD-dependent dihydropyrimidine dehydrogenase PreA subunit
MEAGERADFRQPTSLYHRFIQACNYIMLWVELLTNKIATNKYNPFYYHGALPQFFLWVLFLSGLMLFAYYIPTIDNAYVSKNLVNAWTSVDYITDKLPFGGAVRGIHRYAGDGMVLAILLHMIRVWFTDRYRQYRWVQWLTGVLLLAIVLFIGQTGYYLVWDERSLLLTRMTASSFAFFDPIGIGAPLKAWFLNGPTITDLTLSNFLFIHIGLSFLLLFGLWLHYVRMTRPVITPPPVLNYILMALVLIFVFAFPIKSGLMANINVQPTSFEPDYWFLWPYWLMSIMPLGVYWLILLGGLIILCLLPMPWSFLIKTPPVNAAEVVLDKCTGCSLCFRDCPYQAIEMVPAPAGSRFKLLATVFPHRCSGCGVCVGACAFDAIDLPDLLDTDVTAQIKAIVEAK